MKKELHIISTGRQSLDNLIQKASDIHPYIDFFHIREKHLQEKELVDLIQTLSKRGVPKRKIILNQFANLAALTGIAGVQLGYEGMDVSKVKQLYPDLRVGCSVHSLPEALEKEKRGADHLIYGHIFETASKLGLKPKGIENLRELVQNITVPVIAIGGIQLANVYEVIEAGVSGIAVMSAVLDSVDSVDRVKEFYRLVNKDGG